MPTIKFSLKDMNDLLGKKLSLDELKKLLNYCKAEVDNYDGSKDEVSASFGDTNLPYLWSTEGISRLLKGVIGKERGIPDIKTNNSKYEVIVDGSVSQVRPFIVSFAAKGKKIDDYSMKQMIQLQEKLCESFGRKRQKIAIGIYSLNKIKFPVHYKATNPDSIKFVPLDFRRPLTQKEILEMHPKGKEYSWILKDAKKYPILVDSDDNVLSFPPIINSNETGRVEVGDSDLFFEATGTDIKSLNLAANIFAYALYERGFNIFSVNVKYGSKMIKTPELKTEKIKISENDVDKVLGLSLKRQEIKSLLEKARYGVNGDFVEIPSYRGDILHSVDVIEDIGIIYGYDKIKGSPLFEHSLGKTFDITRFIDNAREIMVGQGYQETMNPILSNTNLLYQNMNVKDFGTIEIENPMSETFSCVRSWIIPSLMNILSKNKHVDYPQRIFEEGIVSVKKGENAAEYERIAGVTAHRGANFTEVRQIIDYMLRMFGLNYEIKEISHDSFIRGRVGRVSVNGVEVAYLGEINPQVLVNFGLELPVAGFELNLTELFAQIKKIK